MDTVNWDDTAGIVNSGLRLRWRLVVGHGQQQEGEHCHRWEEEQGNDNAVVPEGSHVWFLVVCLRVMWCSGKRDGGNGEGGDIGGEMYAVAEGGLRL